MRIISFSDVKFVRAILDGTKTQTIRPLWSKNVTEAIPATKENMKKYTFSQIFPDFFKKPIHKVGDTVKLVYKQRTLKKDWMFCLKCGFVSKREMGDQGIIGHYRVVIPACPRHGTDHLKKKCFALAKITDVYYIYIESQPLDGGYDVVKKEIDEGLLELNKRRKNALAQRDGFKDAKEMLEWFNKNYNLITPKKFAVYRWRLIE